MSKLALAVLLALAPARPDGGAEGSDATATADATRGGRRTTTGRRARRRLGGTRRGPRERGPPTPRGSTSTPTPPFPPSCHPAGKWHVSLTSARLCTNDDDVPPSWEWPSVAENFLFDSWEACCDAMFGGTVGCRGANACADDDPGGGGGDPVGDADGWGDADCEGRRWHVSKSEEETCTNSYDYPSSWNDEYYLGKTVFASQTECCRSLGGRGLSACRVSDTCTGRLHTVSVVAAPAGAGAEEASSCSPLWHPTPSFDGCSNSPPGTYPHDWTVPGVRERYLYDSHDDCCAGVFDYAEGECPVTNHCPTGRPTPSPFACPDSGHRWHKGRGGPNECTNDLSYPSAWDDPAVTDQFLFDTPEECCAKHSRGETCTAVDVCGTLSGTIEPGEPTNLPTGSPAASPVPATGCGRNANKKKCVKDPGCVWDPSVSSCVVDAGVGVGTSGDDKRDGCDGRYHPTSAQERRCTNNDVFPPLWAAAGTAERYFFASGEDCCAEFYGDGPCDVVDVCPKDDG